MAFWNKRIKDTEAIAKKTGVDEKKIKELKSGKRVIGGETMEKVLNAINEEKESKVGIEKKIKRKEAYQWLINTDLNKLANEWGYRNMRELGDVLDIPYSTMYMYANGRLTETSRNNIKIYEFFKDEFNKKPIVVTNNKNKRVTIERKQYQESFDWLMKTDVKKLIDETGIESQAQICRETGLDAPSVSRIINKAVLGPSKKIQTFYEYLNKEADTIEKPTETPQILTKEEESIFIPEEVETIKNEAKNIELDDVIKMAEENLKLAGVETINFDEETKMPTEQEHFGNYYHNEIDRLNRIIDAFIKLIERL